jgi:hypothetical protein
MVSLIREEEAGTGRVSYPVAGTDIMKPLCYTELGKVGLFTITIQGYTYSENVKSHLDR